MTEKTYCPYCRSKHTTWFPAGNAICDTCGRDFTDEDYKPTIRICNYCQVETHKYKLVEAMHGGSFAVCMKCAANECVGCEYENHDEPGTCTQPFCLLSMTIKRPETEETDENS